LSLKGGSSTLLTHSLKRGLKNGFEKELTSDEQDSKHKPIQRACGSEKPFWPSK